MKPLKEDLRRWFKEKWVDVSKKDSSGRHPPCGRSKSSKRGYPKCRPSVRVSSETTETSGEMTDKEKQAATRQKRQAESKPRKGKKPHMTSHKNLKESYEDLLLFESKNSPTNPKLWSRAKALARKKFKVYPSAYANGWASKWYKGKGGGWKTIKENWTEYDIKPGETSESHFDPGNKNFNIKEYMRRLRRQLGIQEKLPGEGC